MDHEKTFEAVEVEMARAERLHGPLTRNLDRSFVIMSEELGEAAEAILKHHRHTGTKQAVRDELIQLASVALLMYETLEDENG